MTTLKTPGVYIEERSVFPPSVAQVETAVPAFIGYTEKAEKLTPNDLHLVPTKVESLVEFRLYFGGAPPLAFDAVNLDSDGAVASVEFDSQYFLFQSLQLFFANGGGKCYIISVGSYDDPIEFGDRSTTSDPGLDVGLAMLERVDEPTMIVFPDAVLLDDAADMYVLQKNALAQCNDLQDRVGIFDLRETDASDATFDWERGVDEFRNNIGTSFLKYGAAYAPHLKTTIDIDVTYRDIRNVEVLHPDRLNIAGSGVTLDVLPGGSTASSAIALLDAAANDLDLLEYHYTGAASETGTIKESLATALGLVLSAADTVESIGDFLHNQALALPDADSSFTDYFDFLYTLVEYADDWLYSASTTDDRTSDDYQAEARTTVFIDLLKALEKLLAFDKGAVSELSFTSPHFKATPTLASRVHDKTLYSGGAPAVDLDSSTADPAAVTDPFAGSDESTKRRASLSTLKDIRDGILSVVQKLMDIAQERYDNAESNLSDQLSTYKNLITELESTLATIPPSGAIAGIYARVDENRGVWKAPANESVNLVRDFTAHFTRSETDGLNVNDYGKSVNALKYFTGVGHLVWGARTLAGNDNEWRYISVRRFFNMVEESVKKSTRWAVFEPNDAGTWLRVKGMIDNFLFLQWRAGALQGAKPEHAFYCHVGLGSTMTPLDILEGRMLVEIGMAVVRPAEFIKLIFMHKMVESG